MVAMTAAVLSMVLGIAPPGAEPAQQTQAAAPRAPWPQELATRGTVLPRGMVEVVLPLGMNLSSDRVASPIFLAPALTVGITNDVSVGIRHIVGVCFNDAAHGCPQPYNDVGLEVSWRVLRGAGADVAVGLGLNSAPLDPFIASIDARVQVRWAGGPLAVALAPSLSIGLNDRDATTRGKRVPVTFPLGTYSFGWFQDVVGNREILTVPAVVELQVIPQLAAAVGLSMVAPVDPIDGGPGDYMTFPFGAAVIVTPTGAFDVGVSLTFRSLFGREKWPQSRPGEARLGQLFVAARF